MDTLIWIQETSFDNWMPVCGTIVLAGNDHAHAHQNTKNRIPNSSTEYGNRTQAEGSSGEKEQSEQ